MLQMYGYPESQPGISSDCPNWLDMLLKVKFFDPCLDHRSGPKERNIYCLDCCVSFCILCTNSHSRHRILQIEKFNSEAVVKTEELETLINCSLIQRYALHTAYVFFVKAHPAKEEVTVEEGVKDALQVRPFEIFCRICSSCPCSLKEEYKYCSVSCKVSKLLRTEGSILRQLRYRSDLLPPSNPVSDGQQFSTEPNSRALTIGKSIRLRQLRYHSNLLPQSIPESNGEQFSAEPSTGAPTIGKSTHSMQNDTEICEFARKKRNKNGVASRSGSVLVRRRKGVPYRSPCVRINGMFDKRI